MELLNDIQYPVPTRHGSSLILWCHRNVKPFCHNLVHGFRVCFFWKRQHTNIEYTKVVRGRNIIYIEYTRILFEYKHLLESMVSLVYVE